jgi:hypothetical protein
LLRAGGKPLQARTPSQSIFTKEPIVPHRIADNPVSVAFFDTVTDADCAVNGLQEAGFSKNQLSIIAPEKFKEHFRAEAPLAQRPGSHAGKDLAEGAGLGMVVGGITLAVAALATGGVGLLPAIPVLIGGGALAGGFSGYILGDGYGKGVGEFYEEAVHLGKIAVGIDLSGESPQRIAEAERILGAGHLHVACSEAK